MHPVKHLVFLNCIGGAEIVLCALRHPMILVKLCGQDTYLKSCPFSQKYTVLKHNGLLLKNELL